MSFSDFLILSTTQDEFLCDHPAGYIREFVKNGAHFIDYETLYRKQGQRFAQSELKRFVAANQVKFVVLIQADPFGLHFDVRFFQELREMVFLAMTVTDADQLFFLRDVYYAQAMDLVICYDCLSRYNFRQYGVPALSFYSAYDGERYFRKDGIDKCFDVSFVGDVAKKMGRRSFLRALGAQGWILRVCGAGTAVGQISLPEMVEVFQRSRINLNFSRLSHRVLLENELEITARRRQIKGRITEIALCGGFVLSEYAPGLEEVYELGKEIAVFTTEAEMLEKIRFFLEHPVDREEMAGRGYQRAMQDYRNQTAIPWLAARIRDHAAKKTRSATEISMDPLFEGYYAAFRAKMMADFFRQGKARCFFEELGIMLRTRHLSATFALWLFLATLFPGLARFLRKTRALRPPENQNQNLNQNQDEDRPLTTRR
jgi:hypothetical protein